MASEEEDVGKILVAMSSDQENEGSTANDASSHGNSDNKGASTTAAAAATVKTSQPKSSNNTSNSGILATSQQQNSSLSGTKRPWEYTAEEQIAKQQFMVGIAWERGYQSLVAYKEKHGNCHVPYRYEGDRSLGTWTARQRKDKDNLSPFQIQKLEEIGFTWQSAQDRVWMEKFERLKSYWGKNGNSCVPTSYEEDPELGEWTAKQRQKYTQGRLSSDRQQLLNTVGFVYRINKFIKRKSTAREDKKWWEQLERLIQFLLEHGHTLVPFQYVADKSLGRWVNEQRCQNMRGLLRQDRKDILTNIGFVWKVASRKGELKLHENADSQARWAYCFRQLVEYKNEHGDFKVPTTGAKAGLGMWAVEQKKLMQTGTMDEMVAQRFAAIGFCSAGEQKVWEKNYQELLKVGYTSIYTLADPCLSHWVICQRYLYKKGNLSNERKMKFFEVNGFAWDSSPLNLPKPEPKHILKARKRLGAEPTATWKPVTKKKKVAAKANPADSDTASESEGEGDLVI